MADPSGNYDLFVSLQDSATDYTNLSLSAFDPVSGSTITSEIVDLSGLTTSTPLVVPPMQGGCSDSDAGAPDADDPDCD